MKNFILCSALLTSLSAYSQPPLGHDALADLLQHPLRPTEDSTRDQARLPLQTLAFTRIAEGQHVLDLFAGSGWYTELLARAVGDQGKVYAQNDEVIWQFAEQGMNKRTADNRLPNVVRFDNMAIVDMDIPAHSLDLVFTALNYHDLFFTEFTRDGVATRVRDEIVDYRAALARIRAAMKDEGTFVIIDHVGHSGSGYDAANTVHRIDPDIVQYQMEEAGFRLLETSYHLSNPDDDLGTNVFAPEVRGKTDRFVYKFVKQ